MIMTITPPIFNHPWGESFLKALQGNTDTTWSPNCVFIGARRGLFYTIDESETTRAYGVSELSFNTEDPSFKVDFSEIAKISSKKWIAFDWRAYHRINLRFNFEWLSEQEGIEIK